MRIRSVAVVALLAGSDAVSAAETDLVGLGSTCSYLIPSVENGGSELLTADWTNTVAPPNEAEWKPGALGIGFAPEHDPYYLVFLRHDVREEMRSLSTTLWAGSEFEIDGDDLAKWQDLQLQMRFDDGFVAYLNGVEIARFNAPEVPAWDSRATSSYPDSLGSIPRPFDIDEHLDLLVPGTNVLSIHLMNAASGSQDAVVLPELSASDEVFGSNRHPRHMEVLALTRVPGSITATVTIGAEQGRRYRLQASTDLHQWFNTGSDLHAESTQLQFHFSIAFSKEHYFRVVEL